MKDKSIPEIFFNKFCPLVKAEWLPGKKNIKSGICASCGTEAELYPYHTVIKPTFPEKDIFDGEGFCEACSFFILNKFFRTYSFVLQGAPKLISHQDAWATLLARLDPPYVISLRSPNFRRFNILYCRINYTVSSRRVVTYDQQEIVYDLIKDQPLFETISTLYNEFGQPKKNIKDRNYNVAKLTNSEYHELLELDKNLMPYRATTLFDMVLDFCQKQEA